MMRPATVAKKTKPAGRRQLTRLMTSPHPADGVPLSVRIPDTGEVIRLADARERLVERESWVSTPPETMRRKLITQIKEFKKLAKVAEAKAEGATDREAGERAGVSMYTAKKWRGGQSLPRSISPKRADLYDRRKTVLRIPKSHAEDFAYVLGVMSAGDACRCKLNNTTGDVRVFMQVKDKWFANRFRDAILASTNLKPSPVKPVKNWHAVSVTSTSLLQVFNELSDYNRRLPTHLWVPGSANRRMLRKSNSQTRFLGNMGERIAFLKGLYDSKGYVRRVRGERYKNITISARTPEERNFIDRVLRENGFNPRQWSTGHILIPSEEAGRFREVFGFVKE